jgi:(2Fe-2S) ferredoxin
MRFRHHVFVCVNARPERGRPACAGRGSAELATQLAHAVLARGIGADVAVTTSGCLGPCFEGPNVVVYPEGVWYRGVGDDDVDEIVEHLAGGAPVERLRRPDDDND